MKKDKLETVAALPDLRALHERHYALIPVQCQYFFGIACVSLGRHHEPPTTCFSIQNRGVSLPRELLWEAPSSRLVTSQHNNDDATRDAAYIVAIAAVEDQLGLVAIDRMETRTGADYLVAPPGPLPDDHEDTIRLEIAGQDRGKEGALRSRLKRKVEQLREGDACRPGMAAVVGFESAMVLMADMETNVAPGVVVEVEGDE